MTPGSWKTVRLDQVCTIVNGGTPKTKVSEYWGGPHQWVTPAEMGKRASPSITDTQRTLTEEGINNCSARLISEGSVIMSSRAPIGHLVMNDVPMSFNQGCKGLVPGPELEQRYLFYYLTAHKPLLESLGTGATFKELSATKLKAVPIPLPPLSEQRRIVGVLDAAFAGLATATAHTQKNLTNARELFDSHLTAVFSRTGTGWRETTIGEQIKLQRGFDITKKQQNPDGVVPVVSSGGVKSFHDTAMAEGPGVVLGRKGSVGAVHFIDKDYWPHDTTLWVKEFRGNDPRLVYHLLKTINLKKLDSGTANPSLNRNLVHPIEVRWPDADLQPSVTRELEHASRYSEALQKVSERKLAALSELKQSILHRAFRGELSGDSSPLNTDIMEAAGA